MQQALWRSPFRFWPGGILSFLRRWKKQWFLNSNNSHPLWYRGKSAHSSLCSCQTNMLVQPVQLNGIATQQPPHQCRVSSIRLKQKNPVTICCVPCVLLQFLGRSCQPCPWTGSFVAELLASILNLAWSLGTSGNPYWAQNFPKCFIRGPYVWYSKEWCEKGILWSNKLVKLGRKIR